MSTVCHSIQVDPVDKFTQQADLVLHRAAALKLQLPATVVRINLSFGSCEQKVNVRVVAGDTPLIRLSRSVAQQLAIPDGVRLHLHYDRASKTLVLGPLLAILVSRRQQGKEMFGQLTPFCREVIQTARMKGAYAYVMSVQDVQLNQEKIRGWVYRNHSWISSNFPFPHAIYNRLGSRSQEKRENIQEIMGGLKGKGCKIFNEQFLNKWQVYQALSSIPSVSYYLPETVVYHGYQSLKQMLDKHAIIYVKPTDGSMGRGIYRIRRHPRGYLCQHSTLTGSVSRIYKNINALYQGMSPRISKIPYLVQQGIRLISQGGNPIDIRVLIQKNRQGKWGITSMVARTGSNRNIVSNIARGGNIGSVKQTLRRLPGPKPSITQVRSAALQIGNALEKSMAGHYAELGIDLCVDTSGKLWLLEINSKPSKTEDTLHPAHHGPRPSVVRMVDYTFHLAGFPIDTTIPGKKRVRKSKRNMLKKKRRN